VSQQDNQPLMPYQSMLEHEIQQAVSELERPVHGLLLSAASAGFGVGISMLLIAVVVTLGQDEQIPPAVTRLLRANAYAVGFIIVILGRMDLFTEFTTIAILPVLSGRAPLGSLARLWGVVYLGNMIGAFLFALVAVALGPAVGAVAPHVFGDLARELTTHHWWVILLSASLAGWLMGVLSWLITGGRDTISQVFFIWIIALAIGLGQLHHVITGAVEVMAGLMGEGRVATGYAWHFLLWTTLGNAIGGVVFAASMRFSMTVGHRGSPDPEGQPRQR
jgi:formate-nitrite transporter family protein